MVRSFLLRFEEHDRRILWVAVLFFICSLTLYVYWLGVSVFAVIDRKGAEQRTAAIASNIMSLESRYVVLSRDIDLALARERGFVTVEKPVYLDGDAGSGSFSLRKGDR